MESIFKNEAKIKIYANIQKLLNNLRPNSPDKDITILINQIPSDYLNQKEELMMICQLFAYYARNSIITIKGNAIKLFEKIMEPIKTYLQDESSFFWRIFGGILYFKLWMHKNGLISMQEIIQKIRANDSIYIAEYFYPEIIEQEPEIYEKEIKPKLSKQYSNKDMIEFRKLREKHFEWLRNSNDFHNPLYREIEKNQLRLAIKTDDIDTFQKILSNLNISVNSKIRESLLENFYRIPQTVSLIEFAVTFNSIKIFKFLIMNDALIFNGPIFTSISQRSYDIFHIIEHHKNREISDQYLFSSILSWNDEVTEYVLDNYDYDFIEQENIDSTKDDIFIEMFKEICISFNFQFLHSIFLPFLRKNPLFLSRNLHVLFTQTFFDLSGYFASEILKCPGIDFNNSEVNNEPLVIDAIRNENIRVIKMFLENPLFDVNSAGNGGYQPLIYICSWFTDIKILEMFCNHPKIKINEKSPHFNITAIQMSVTRGNTYAFNYFAKKDKIEINEGIFNVLFYYCVTHQMIYSLQCTLKFYLSKIKGKSNKEITEKFREIIHDFNGFKEEYVDKFREVINDVTRMIVKPPTSPPGNVCKARLMVKGKTLKTKKIIYKPKVQKK